MDLLHTAHIPAGEGPFPTVVGLHGWGANAHDLLGLAPFLHGGQALVLSPEGPVSVPIGPGVEGRGWFPISGGGPPDPREFAAGAQALRTFLDAAVERYPVDPRKLVLLGFSQGGVMAYDLFLREPERFAGMAALSSWLPPVLTDAIPKQPVHEGRPVFVAHGTRDPMIDVARGRESRDALLRYGLAVTCHEYEMGHEIAPETLRDLMRWLEEKVLSPIQLV